MTSPPPPEPRTVDDRLAAVEVALHRLMGDRPPPVWSWLTTTDPDTARDILTDLTEWVHTVWLSWPDAQLPGCWAHHPDLVEELWSLRNLWRAHESRNGTWAARVDWLERYRPAAAKRISARDRRHDSCVLDPTHHPQRPTADDIDRIATEHCTQSPDTTAPHSP